VLTFPLLRNSLSLSKECGVRGIFPRFYIGDVHGCAEELRRLLSFIETFCDENSVAPQVTFLGDLIDRGPRSMQAVECVRRTLRAWPGSLTLRGNHDDLFLANIASRAQGEHGEAWLYLEGGVETLLSYDTDTRRGVIFPLIETLYAEHISLLRNTKSFSVDGPFLACHAGVKPGVPISEQTHFDLTWIREEFLEHVDANMMPVIHGHSPIGERPVVTENRISLDTGCFSTGLLTACFVDERNRSLRFFQATKFGAKEVEPALLDRNLGTVYDRLDELFSVAEAA
jgi:serine/threonine protein phosphatase 1